MLLTTPDTVTLSVQEWGNARGAAIVFIHGISQCHRSWRHQYESDLAQKFRLITYDLRGHGDSSKPLDAASYQENPRWAGDLNCILEHLQVSRPVLVGWSYAGRVICDYLQTYGDDNLAGINFVSASTKTSPEFASPGGKFMRGMMSSDATVNLEATKSFLRLCTTEPLPAAELDSMLAYNQLNPAEVRAHMLTRQTPYEDALKKVSVPVLITHGEKDQIVVPAVSRYTASVIPHAQLSFYPSAGHIPFREDTPRFNRELEQFVTACTKNKR